MASLALGTIGGVGLWTMVVVLPAVQAEFGVARGEASLPYTATMIGFTLGGLLMGRFVDRLGIIKPLIFGTMMLALGYAVASQATSLWQFILAQGVLIGMLGSSASFSPLVADISLWFKRRRGIAVAICASGNYLAGTIWPPLIERGIAAFGWRHAYLLIGAAVIVLMLPIILVLRRKPPEAAISDAASEAAIGSLGLSPARLQAALIIAGLTCCLAMAMPQVHIVAYCADLGYGVARGAEMVALMFGLGVISRLASGWISDRIGGLRTMLLGSSLQCLTLLLYLPFDGLMSLYVVTALFGLSQGGIVPSYAIIVREFMPAKEAGARVSTVLMATIAGMAIGGWLTGAIYDWTGSYRAAFLNGIAWNFVNMAIGVWLLMRSSPRRMNPQPA
jgi:MFS family permease